MSQRYNVEDLLKLRESPLVCKPPSLPPQEEWMGATQEVATRRTSALRGKPDDTILQGEPFQKRPNLLDHRKSVSASSELFLGPRKFGTRRKSNAQDDGDEGSKHKDSVGLEQSKDAEDARDRLGDRRGGRHEGLNARYSSRTEGDEFQNGRYRRKEDRDDAETKPRQDTDDARDRPRWRARNGQEDQSVYEDEKDRTGENGRQGPRRDAQGRAKFEQPWFRNDKAADITTDRKAEAKQQEWRRDRDWDRSARVEADPEWMDSAEIEEPAQAHTQADFQRWKERMKAGGTRAEEKPETTSKIVTDSAAIAEDKKAANLQPSAVISSPEMNDAMDKFFARFNEPKAEQEQKPQAKAPTKTRFAALWSAPPEPTPAPAAVPSSEKPPPQAQSPAQADADQAGFARILQMLGSRSSNSTPQDQGSQMPKIPLYTKAEQGAQGRMRSPDFNSMLVDSEQPPRNRTARVQESAGSERLSDSRSPNEGAHVRQESGPNKETSQLLLNLMRQANLGNQAQQTQFASEEPRQTPGPGPMAEHLNRTATSRNQLTSVNTNREPGMPQRRETTGSSFVDEPPMSGMSYREEQGPDDFRPDGLRRRPTNGPPPPFYDDPYLANLRQNAPQPPKNLAGNHMSGQGLPPGLHRPPGLDQMQRMPPGWATQQQQPPQQQPLQQRQAPPPGIPNLPRGMPAPFASSNLNMPMPQHLQQQQPPPNQGLQRPQRKYTGDSGQGFPPAMGPPPGFMNNGPPPGFPGAPQTYGRYQIGSEPQGMPRGFAPEFYGSGQAERSLLRGGAGPTGNGMPGPYR